MLNRHLDDHTIDAYAAARLDAGDRERATAHLAQCERCRRAVHRQREISELTRSWPTLRQPSGALLDVALQRRAAGERVILPTEPAHAATTERRSWRRVVAAAMVVLMAGTALLLTRTPQAAASASELVIMPALPAPGESVKIVYRPALELAGAAHIVVRAHLRTRFTPQHRPDNGWARPDFRYATVALLHPQSDGTYHGAFDVPDDVVFATLAVETPDGDAIDANSGHFWRLLTRAADGRPSLDGLLQWVMEYTDENSLLILEAARLIRAHYPERPIGWMLEMAGEAWTAGSGAAALEPEWRRRTRDLHRRHRDDTTLTGDDLAAMVMITREAEDDDPAAHEHWKARLVRERPGHGMAITQQYQDVVAGTSDARTRLDALDAIWRAGAQDASGDPTNDGPLSLDMRNGVAATGMRLARTAGTAAEQGLWLERLDALGPPFHTQTALLLTWSSELADEAERRLRNVIAALEQPDDARRGIGTTRASQTAIDLRNQAYRRADFGKMLMREGRTREAAAELDRAASMTEVYHTVWPLIEVRLALADTVGAMQAWARLLADPVQDTPAQRDTARLQSGSHYDEAAFAAAVEAARTARVRAALASARPRRPQAALLLADSTGSETNWGAVHDGRETVVVFWSRYCAPAMNRLPELARSADAMAAQGVRTILVTQDAHTPAFRKFVREAGIRLPIFHDVTGELSRALANNGTPMSYLVDRQGRARWRPASPYSLELQLLALRSEVDGSVGGTRD
jgi:hypothetical protein